MTTFITINPLPTPAVAQGPFQSQSSFTQRLITITVQLVANPTSNQPGTFDESGTDTVTLSGIRASVRITASGAKSGSTANIKVYGLTSSLMNQLTTLGRQYNYVPINKLLVSAGSSTAGLSPIFGGTINEAYGEYESAPDVSMFFNCTAGLGDAVAPAVPSSFPKATDVATVMANFARSMSLGFENNGITAQMPPSYHPGTLWDQVQSYADMAHIIAQRVDGDTILAIWPIGGSRNTNASSIPIVSAATGMIGYPSYTQQGIIVKTLFNPQIAFGGKFQVQSSLPRANGTWAANTMDLALDSQVPHGQWMQTINAWNPMLPRPVQPPTANG